ncbi:MAG: lipoprotein-releasing ABC transporter permease subunit [Magnetococcales bacterium]|nr:lipoprotein-releasing ABC transporter permease subunit [Magnetococcales bacterium]
MKRYEWFVGLRYLRAKRSERFINVITLLSMSGVVLGVAALITVLAVMTGFRDELQRQILGVTSHVTIRSTVGNMGHYRQTLDQVTGVPGVMAAAPYIAVQGMVARQGVSAGLMVRGMDPGLEGAVSSLAANLVQGKLEEMPEFGIIPGRRLAERLHAELNDTVTLTVAVGAADSLKAQPRMQPFRIVGIFDSGMYEYDNAMAYIRLQDAQRLLEMSEAITGIELRTTTAEAAPMVAEAVRKRLGKGIWIQDWMEMNRNFFKVLQVQKTVLFVILLLVVLVAAFNIISSLIMVVMEKGKEIAILKTMGARSSGIMQIFVANGGVIGVVGTGIGTVFGLLLSWNLEALVQWIEQSFGVQLISGEVYFIDRLPAKVVTSDVLWVTGTSLAITLLATLYPAWRAARVDPVELLRHD